MDTQPQFKLTNTRFQIAFFFSFFYFLFASCVSDNIVTEQPNNDTPPSEEQTDNLPPDNPAPTFTLQTSDGQNINLSDYQGKVVTLFFFGYGCPPCKAVAPSIQEQLATPYESNDDYAILGLDVWDGNSAGVDAFKSATEVRFPLLLEASSIARDYETTYDRLVVVDKDGGIVFLGTQIAMGDLESVKNLVISLLGS